MDPEFYDLRGCTEVDESALAIPRAIALCRAIHRRQDTRLLKTFKKSEATATAVEVLVIEMDCEGVPSRNAAGIQYCERLALFVTSNKNDIPEVVALRNAFPVMMHQNQGQADGPANLCVYFGPKSATLRTLTPESFLHRIRWWLEGSARGELHPADQPVEQLFFTSRYELVLPWNVDELSKSSAHRAIIFAQTPRPDDTLTCFLEFVEKAAPPKPGTVAHIEVTLPAVVHGFVDRDPPTLGALADVLEKRGVDVISPLRAALKALIGSKGATKAEEDDFTIVLLCIPISRAEGAAPEKQMRRAFAIVGGRLALGKAMGVYMVHEGKYYSAEGLLGAEAPTQWRNTGIEAMEVLQRNTTAMARAHSGINDEGPAGVLIGGGTLGCTMLGLWGRSGWGSWTVIDNDHIKPHNLSRHPALGQQVGEMKAIVAAELHGFAMQGASEVKGICADACDFKNAAVIAALESNKVVIDASTTLEYPRLASTRDGLARHASVFVTPDGNSSVMLVEDAAREQKLRTLEAQYYRAVIGTDWGKSHLEGNLRHFWSGASCRDISVVLACSRITAHAATLAEQLPLAFKQPEASIRIWHRDSNTGAVSVYQAAPFAERRMTLGEYDLYIDNGLYERLVALRAAQLPQETGGILLGYYDLNVNAVVLVDALAAPPDSKGSREAFERGIAGLRDAVSEAARRTVGVVGYVGEWHSHPPGHAATPSSADSYQLVYLALHMAEDGLPAVQLIVGENDFLVRQAAVIA